jgi:hypothetical protein
VASTTDALDDPGAVRDDGQRRPARPDLLAASLLASEGNKLRTKSVERAGRPGRLTGMAAGGSVARLETVSVSGQPRSLAAAARASPAVSASTTQVRTTSPASSRHDQPTNGRPYHSGGQPRGEPSSRRLAAIVAASDLVSDAP